MSHPSLSSALPHAASLVDTSKLSSTPRLRNRGNHRIREIGEYDDTANKERVKDIEKAVKGELMGSVILDIDGLVENIFPPVLFERLRGEHDPICLENDPDHPDHMKVPLDKPATDNGGTSEASTSSDNGPAEESPAPNAQPNSGARRGGKKRPNPKIPKPDPCPIIDHIFRGLSTGKQPLYSNGKWSGWPDTSNPEMESKVCTYLNRILGRARKLLPGSRNDTQWAFSPRFATKELKLDQVCRKPDVILAPNRRSQSVRWQLIRSVGEIRSSRYQTERQLAEGRLAQYSRLMFGDDYARRFNLLFSLIKDEMALFLFDRAGVLGSKRFNVHKDPKNLLRIVLGLALAEDYFVGLDPSFFIKDAKRFVKLNNEEYEILETLHLQSVIRGRGTVALRVLVDPENGTEGVIKDQWVDVTRDRHEFFWLLYLKEHGAKNIATLRDHQLVRFRIDGITVVDNTSALRGLISDWDISGIETREHRRVMVTPAGKLLKYFRSLKELVSVFKDFAEGILSIYEADVFHRDISRRNLVIFKGENDEIGKGYVIDFDCAAFCDHTRCAVAELTGTVPFMAISILKNNGCPHRYHYELESLFYSLIWICLTADEKKVDGHPTPTTKFSEMQLQLWCGPELDDPKNEAAVFVQIAAIKALALNDVEEFEKKILSRLPPYFEPIHEMLEDLRDLLFRPKTKVKVDRPDMVRVQDREARDVFPEFISIFDKALKKLEAIELEQRTEAVDKSRTGEVADASELDDMERAAQRRVLGRRGKKHATPVDGQTDRAEPSSDGDDDSEGAADSAPDSPTPRPAEGPQNFDLLVLGRPPATLASGSRTAVSRVASRSMTEVSKTAISFKGVSLAYKCDTTHSVGSSDHISPGSGHRGSDSRDTSSVRGKRAAPEAGQAHSSSKRRRNQ